MLEALDPPNPEAAANGRRQLICIANTHIHANPELNDVKLWQVRQWGREAPERVGSCRGLKQRVGATSVSITVCGNDCSAVLLLQRSGHGQALHAALPGARVYVMHRPSIRPCMLEVVRGHASWRELG